MSRLFVPVTVAAMVSGLALVLIWGIVLRSPDTHANIDPRGYGRTRITYVGQEEPFTGIGLADPAHVTDLDQGARGRLLSFASGCAACHGLAAQGGVIGPGLDPAELSLSEFRREVRSGPKGMPAFTEWVISDADIELLYTYLKALRDAPAGEADASPSPP